MKHILNIVLHFLQYVLSIPTVRVGNIEKLTKVPYECMTMTDVNIIK